MSVFVDLVPDEPKVDPSRSAAPAQRWKGLLTKAGLPLLSVLVFFAVWQTVATLGIWNETFVPYPSTVWRAFVDVSTTHDGTRGYAGYLLHEHLYMTLRRVFIQVIRDVVVPSALPETFTGIRLAVGMAYSSVVAAELFNGIPGIGGLVKDASNYNNTPVVLVGIFAIGVSGLIIDGLLRTAERRYLPWIGKV